MTSFDPLVIQVFADALYAKAARIALSSAIAATLVGLVIGAIAAQLTGFPMPFAIGALALLGGWLGYLSGQSRAFSLKLQAQTALCQVAIERNTRSEGNSRLAAQA